MEILHLTINMLHQFLRVHVSHVSRNNMLSEVVAIHATYLPVIFHSHHWVDDALQTFLYQSTTAKVGSSLHQRIRMLLQLLLQDRRFHNTLATPFLESLFGHFHVHELSLRKLLLQLVHLSQELLLSLRSLLARLIGSNRHTQFNQLPQLIRSNHVPRNSQPCTIQLLCDTLSNLRIRNHSHRLSPARQHHRPLSILRQQTIDGTRMPRHKSYGILCTLSTIATGLLALRNLPFHNLDVTSGISPGKLVVHHRC